MEARATEDIPIGEDLMPPLSPIAAALHNSAVPTHCAACFSTLPPHQLQRITPAFSKTPHDDTPTLLYCSPRCSSLDSPLHFSSAEEKLLSLLHQSPSSTWDDSADLRLSLRLLYRFEELNLISQSERDFRNRSTSDLENNDNHCSFHEIENRDDGVLERIAGLMTNRERLIFRGRKNETGLENVENLREGTKLVAVARRMHGGVDVNEVALYDSVVEEMVLCLVLTNAVEVNDQSGYSVGIAVYGTTFSWINHSCSPNACYRFSTKPELSNEMQSRIYPSAMEDGNKMIEDGSKLLLSGRDAYGPSVILQSIKAVSKGEDVTIAYTDVFQPKEMRQSELWSKYQFICGCKRCSAEPASYVDSALQAACVVKADCLEKISDDDPSRYEQRKNVSDFVDNIINQYLQFGDCESSCEKLENFLSHGYSESPQILKLHPFHHLSLNAYATLASIYKSRAVDFPPHDYGIDRNDLEAFNMHRISTAYSLLHAGVANHLFNFEPSLMASVANSWKNAGESLVALAKCSSLTPPLISRCTECSLVDSLEANFVSKKAQNVHFEEITRQFCICISAVTSKLWRLLIHGSSYLQSIENPIEFSWLSPPDCVIVSDFVTKAVIEKDISQLEAPKCTEEDRMNLSLLSIHCLRYGAFLSGIFYGCYAV